MHHTSSQWTLRNKLCWCENTGGRGGWTRNQDPLVASFFTHTLLQSQMTYGSMNATCSQCKEVIFPFIHLLNAPSVPGMALNVWDTSLNKAGKGIYLAGGDRQ